MWFASIAARNEERLRLSQGGVANVLFRLNTELTDMYGCSHNYNIYPFTNVSRLF